MVLRLPLLSSVFCKELTDPFRRHICFTQWSLGIVYALVCGVFALICGVFALQAKYCIPGEQWDASMPPWLWGNCARAMPRQRWGSSASREVIGMWLRWFGRQEMLALLHLRVGIGPFYLLDITIKDHCSSSQPTSPLRSSLPLQKKFKQKIRILGWWDVDTYWGKESLGSACKLRVQEFAASVP